LTVLAVGSCFVFDGWVARNRVFARSFVTVRRFGKKPGFSRLWMGCQKPGFCQNICYGAKIWEKTRFLKIGWVARNRVFARIFVTVRRFGKKPGFSRLGGLPETGFLRDPSLQPTNSGKNPVSQDCGWVARNRVFARSFVTTHKFGKKPGFF